MKATVFLYLTLALTSTAGAQTVWRFPAGVGGATLGAGAGWTLSYMMWGDNPTLNLTPVGLGVGAWVGWVAGTRADARLARGDTLSSGGRFWLRFTTFLTPVALGAVTTSLIVNRSRSGCDRVTTSLVIAPPEGRTTKCAEPPPDASERSANNRKVALIGVGGGTIAGYFIQRAAKDALWPKPRLSLAPTATGAAIGFAMTW